MDTIPRPLMAGVSGTPGKEEIFTLAQSGAVRIERIISNGQCSPESFWYDQEDSEWVLLVRGIAFLEYEDGRKVELRAGDYLLIPPHLKHRVDWTSPDAVWLAFYFK